MILHEESPKYGLWGKAVIAFVPILFVVLVLLYFYGVLPTESEKEARIGMIALFGLAVFIMLLFWAILPRKYQILEDKLKIVLGGPFSWNIGFDSIKEARMAGWEKALAYVGIRLCTSTKNVEVVRSKGMNVVISPSNRELFLEELSKAMANWKRRRRIPGSESF